MKAQAKAVTRIIAISTLITLISACGGSDSDDALHADLDPLPGANSSLDTQTTEGIWLIQSSQVGNYTLERANTNMNTVRSVRQFVVIKQQADGSYSMPECGLDLFKELNNVSLRLEDSRVIDSGFSYQRGNDEETYSLDFTFVDNLTFSGTIDLVLENSGEGFSYKDNKTAVISAVKVSDSMSFESADELSIAFNAQLNSATELALIDMAPAVSCLAVSSAIYSGSQVGNVADFQENAVYITDTDDNEAKFVLMGGNLAAEVITYKSYSSSLTSLSGSGEPSCATNDESCVLASSLTLIQSSITSGDSINGITANVIARSEDDESLNISFSVEIK